MMCSQHLYLPMHKDIYTLLGYINSIIFEIKKPLLIEEAFLFIGFIVRYQLNTSCIQILV